MTDNYLRLGVNIDHIATIRNARGGEHPDPVLGALEAIKAGADGITAHLREDRRHITDDDIERLQALCEEHSVPLNMEMAATSEMVDIAKHIKPHAICLVPERREERTTEGGLNVRAQHNILAPIIRELSDIGSRVSLFIEADPIQIKASARLGAPVIEIHAGTYAHAVGSEKERAIKTQIKQIEKAAKLGSDLGLEIHAGHGLTFENVGPMASISEIKELNIGHFLIGEAIFSGLSSVIKTMRARMDEARP